MKHLYNAETPSKLSILSMVFLGFLFGVIGLGCGSKHVSQDKEEKVLAFSKETLLHYFKITEIKDSITRIEKNASGYQIKNLSVTFAGSKEYEREYLNLEVEEKDGILAFSNASLIMLINKVSPALLTPAGQALRGELLHSESQGDTPNSVDPDTLMKYVRDTLVPYFKLTELQDAKQITPTSYGYKLENISLKYDRYKTEYIDLELERKNNTYIIPNSHLCMLVNRLGPDYLTAKGRRELSHCYDQTQWEQEKSNPSHARTFETEQPRSDHEPKTKIEPAPTPTPEPVLETSPEPENQSSNPYDTPWRREFERANNLRRDTDSNETRTDAAKSRENSTESRRNPPGTMDNTDWGSIKQEMQETKNAINSQIQNELADVRVPTVINFDAFIYNAMIDGYENPQNGDKIIFYDRSIPDTLSGFVTVTFGFTRTEQSVAKWISTNQMPRFIDAIE